MFDQKFQLVARCKDALGKQCLGKEAKSVDTLLENFDVVPSLYLDHHKLPLIIKFEVLLLIKMFRMTDCYTIYNRVPLKALRHHQNWGRVAHCFYLYDRLHWHKHQKISDISFSYHIEIAIFNQNYTRSTKSGAIWPITNIR